MIFKLALDSSLSSKYVTFCRFQTIFVFFFFLSSMNSVRKMKKKNLIPLFLPVDDSILCHFELLGHAHQVGLQQMGGEGVGVPHAPQQPPVAQKKQRLSPTV